jgi:hypothetical protein
MVRVRYRQDCTEDVTLNDGMLTILRNDCSLRYNKDVWIRLERGLLLTTYVPMSTIFMAGKDHDGCLDILQAIYAVKSVGLNYYEE